MGSYSGLHILEGRLQGPDIGSLENDGILNRQPTAFDERLYEALGISLRVSQGASAGSP